MMPTDSKQLFGGIAQENATAKSPPCESQLTREPDRGLVDGRVFGDLVGVDPLAEEASAHEFRPEAVGIVEDI